MQQAEPFLSVTAMVPTGSAVVATTVVVLVVDDSAAVVGGAACTGVGFAA